MLIIDDGWANTGRRGARSVIRLRHFLLATLTTHRMYNAIEWHHARNWYVSNVHNVMGYESCRPLRIRSDGAPSSEKQLTAQQLWRNDLNKLFLLTDLRVRWILWRQRHRSIVLSSKFEVYSFNQRIIVYFLHFVTWHIFFFPFIANMQFVPYSITKREKKKKKKPTHISEWIECTTLFKSIDIFSLN